MSQGTGSEFAQFKILVGDGGDPVEAFAFICGVTEKNISYDSETVTTEMPDCADESLPSYKNIGVKSVGIQMDCSGMWTQESHGTLINWWKSAAPKNVKVQYADAAPGAPEYLTGPCVLTNLKHSAPKGGFMTGSFSLMFTVMPAFANAS